MISQAIILTGNINDVKKKVKEYSFDKKCCFSI